MSEDTNTNEKKFHLDEFAMLLGNRMNARREEGGQVCSLVFFLEQIQRPVKPGARHEAATCDLWRADCKVSLNSSFI